MPLFPPPLKPLQRRSFDTPVRRITPPLLPPARVGYTSLLGRGGRRRRAAAERAHLLDCDDAFGVGRGTGPAERPPQHGPGLPVYRALVLGRVFARKRWGGGHAIHAGSRAAHTTEEDTFCCSFADPSQEMRMRCARTRSKSPTNTKRRSIEAKLARHMAVRFTFKPWRTSDAGGRVFLAVARCASPEISDQRGTL